MADLIADFIICCIEGFVCFLIGFYLGTKWKE